MLANDTEPLQTTTLPPAGDQTAPASDTPGQTLKKHIANLLLMTGGSILVAIGVYFFKFPNHFTTGGVSGLSILLGKVIPADFMTPGLLNSIINVVFLLLGFLILNTGFGVRTIYCTLLYSGAVQFFEWAFPLSGPLTGEKMLELFFSFIFPALGSALLFNVDASTGGTDIMAMILKKFTGLDVGKSLLISDCLIAASALIVFDVETGLFSLLGLAMKSFLVDAVMETLNQKKAFMIVTRNQAIITRFITEELNRSATLWQGKGAYTHNDQYVILTVLSRHQAIFLRTFLRRNDPHAFMLVTSSSEIFGKGFLQA